MNSLDPLPWTRARWVWTFVFVLGVQLLLVWCLSDRTPLRTRVSRLHTTIHWVTDPREDQHLANLCAASDPTLFALANPHNFSGAAWLTPVPREHRCQDWVDSAHWLTQDCRALGLEFPAFVHSRAAPLLLVAEKPPPKLLELLVPPLTVASQSLVRVEGRLAERGLGSMGTLPVWPYSGILPLPQTVVEVAVNSQGDTLVAQLRSRCGWPPADQYALRWAKTARFRPSRPAARNPAALSWGQLVFDWSTTSTNLIATNR